MPHPASARDEHKCECLIVRFPLYLGLNISYILLHDAGWRAGRFGRDADGEGCPIPMARLHALLPHSGESRHQAAARGRIRRCAGTERRIVPVSPKSRQDSMLCGRTAANRANHAPPSARFDVVSPQSGESCRQATTSLLSTKGHFIRNDMRAPANTPFPGTPHRSRSLAQMMGTAINGK